MACAAELLRCVALTRAHDLRTFDLAARSTRLYVEQPAAVSLADLEKSALASLWELLDAPRRRFVLVLGD